MEMVTIMMVNEVLKIHTNNILGKLKEPNQYHTDNEQQSTTVLGAVSQYRRLTMPPLAKISKS
jgi:hypothetical protein